MPEHEGSGAFIPTREIYDILVEVRDDVRTMKEADLTNRVRKLETRTLAFPASIVTSFLAIVAVIITRIV